MSARTQLSVLAAVVALGCTVSAAQAVTVTEVGSGLVSPRHLDFSPSGNLYVAEVGRGGDGPCVVGGEGPACFGATGAVTKISRHGHQSRIVDGLASLANVPDQNGTTDNDGDSGIGPHGITALGDHAIFVTNGGPTAPAEPDGTLITRDQLAAQDPAANGFGRRLWVFGKGRYVSVADIYANEQRNNPDGGAIDTNATDVLVDHGRFVISDAGGNDVLTASGPRIRTLSVFPDVPDVPSPFGGTVDMQAVPTSIVEGPDGAYYMSQLTGFPFPVGGANVYRINPRTGKLTVFARGFTNIMDLAFDWAGTLYVLEIDHDGLLGGEPFGAIHAITRKGKRSTVVRAEDQTLTAPGGITVGPRGALYVTNNARSPDSGAVLRIDR